MNRNRLLTLLPAILAAAILAGCTDKVVEGYNPYDPNSVASIELRASPISLNGFKGELRTATITAIPRNSLGAALESVPIVWSIDDPENWKGTITSQDSSGTADYTVQLAQSGDVVIRATAGNVTSTVTISLGVIGPMAHFTLEAPDTVFIPIGQTVTFYVIATCTDSAGLGVPGIHFRLRVSPPGLAATESDTATTDSDGKYIITCTTIKGRTGTLSIIMSLGDSVATAHIEIVGESGPAHLHIICDTPSIEAQRGEDATIDYAIVVTDGQGRGMFNVPVSVWLAEYLPGTGTFGAIGPPFISLGGFGKEYIVAKVDGVDEVIADSLLISVNHPAPRFGRISAWATPDHLDWPSDSVRFSLISAICVDTNNVAIPNLFVQFSTDLGRLARITPTDSTGVATMEFYVVPFIDFPSPDSTEMTLRIIARISGTDFADTVWVRVRKTE